LQKNRKRLPTTNVRSGVKVVFRYAKGLELWPDERGKKGQAAKRPERPTKTRMAVSKTDRGRKGANGTREVEEGSTQQSRARLTLPPNYTAP